MSSIIRGKQNKYKSSFKKKTKFNVAVMDIIDETSNSSVTGSQSQSTANVDSAFQDITGNITPVLTANVSLLINTICKL